MKPLTKNFLFYPHLYLVLLPIGLIIYSNIFFGGFVLDDTAYVTESPWIRSLWNFLDVSGVRYAGDLSFALNYKLSGLAPFGYHVVNVLIHIANSALVFQLVRTLFETPFFKVNLKGREFFPPSAALITAVLFLTHPLQTQAVSYISQRYTSLAAFFYLLTIVLYIRSITPALDGKRGGKAFYAAALLSAVLAMKTKEISFTLPIMLSVVDLAAFPGKGRLARLLPFFITLAIIPLSLLLPEAVTGAGNKIDEIMRMRKLEELSTISRYAYVITQGQVITTYLRLMFFPVNQHFTYYFPLAESLFDIKVAGPLLAVISMLAASIYIFIRSVIRNNFYGCVIAFGVIWFFLALSVESSVIPIRDAINEHRVYLPSIGIILSAVSGVFYIAENLGGGRWRPAFTIFLLALAVPLSFATYLRNEIWRTPLRLYEDEVKKNPISISPHMYLGVTYFDEKKLDSALKEFKEAEAIDPSSTRVQKTLLKFYVSVGNFDEALMHAKALARLSPDDPGSVYNVGVVYILKGLYKDAEREMREVLRRWPDYKHASDALSVISSKKMKEKNTKRN